MRAGTRLLRVQISNVEGFTATAAVLFPRVVELESLVQPFAREIKLRTVDVRQAFRVDEDLHTMTFKQAIFGLRDVGIFELVRHPRAAGRAYAQAQTNAAAAFSEITRDMLCRRSVSSPLVLLLRSCLRPVAACPPPAGARDELGAAGADRSCCLLLHALLLCSAVLARVIVVAA